MKEGEVIKVTFSTKYFSTKGIREHNDLVVHLGRPGFVPNGTESEPGEAIYLSCSMSRNHVFERLGGTIFLTREEAVEDAKNKKKRAIANLKKRIKKLESLEF